jgi:hypothetical protein
VQLRQRHTQPGIPADVTALMFLQRVARNDGVGNVFDYTSYRAGRPAGEARAALGRRQAHDV